MSTQENTIKIDQIIQYPIKGFRGETVLEATLSAKNTLPGDRQFAIKYVDRKPPVNSDWLPKKFFVQSVHTNICANIDLKWQENSFEIPNGDILQRTIEGVTQFARWITNEYPELGFLEAYAAKGALTDEPKQFISLINLATVDAIAEATDTKSIRERYRGNLFITELDPFTEINWIGRRIRMGTLECHVEEQIARCLATECNWQDSRDLGFLKRLEEAFKTQYCGLFLVVDREGTIATGDALEFLD